MNDRARRVDELFDRALDAPDRDAFLASCGELRADVEELLDAHAKLADDFLARPAADRLATLAAGTRVGQYTIGRRLASGGAGIVYEAEQERPRRTVALKVMRTTSERFDEEAEVLARLDHPAIATVFEAGRHDGATYIAMELVQGPTLLEWAKERPRAEVLRRFADVCDAVHHGHLKGVIHRDLKPQNVLVRDTGPKIIDFGIAAVEGETRAEIAGTLPYMSPEQCDPDADLDPRSDVYALGVVLYELLRGQLPYDVTSTSLRAAHKIIREVVPPDLGGDLGAVVARALAKEREDRYVSAAALADDVRRHLRHEPVAARRTPWPHLVWLFARRRTAVTVSLAALFAAMVAGTVVSLRLAAEARHSAAREREATYAARLAAADAALRVHDAAVARAALDATPPAGRGWEWRHLRGRLERSERVLDGTLARLTDGGARVHVVRGEGARGSLVSLDSRTGAELASRPVVATTWWNVAPDGSIYAWGGYDGSIEFRRFADDGLVATLHHNDDQIKGIAFDPGGEVVATFGWDRKATLARWRDGAVLGTATAGEDDWFQAIEFAPDGGTVAVARRTGKVDVRDGGDFALRRTFAAHRGRVSALAFAPDGTLATAGADHRIRIWRPGPDTPHELMQRRETATALAFLRGGERLAAGFNDGTITVWDVERRDVIETFVGHTGYVECVAEIDDDTIVSSANDKSSRIWRIPSPEDVTPQPPVRTLAYSPDGRTLVAGCYGALVRIVDGRTGVERRRIRLDSDRSLRVQAVAFRGDGRRVVCGGGTGRCFVLDTADWSIVKETKVGPTLCSASYCGGKLVLGLGEETLVCDAETLAVERRLPSPEWSIDCVGTGDDLIVATHGGRVTRWRPDGKAWERDLGRGGLTGLALHPNGRDLAVTSWAGPSEIWDVDTGAYRRTVSERPSWRAVFSPDGTRIAVGGYRAVHLFDHGSGRALLDLRGHEQAVYAVAFSPDGSRLASGGAYGRIVVRR